MDTFRWGLCLKKLFSLVLVLLLAVNSLHAIVFVPVTSHQHFGEVVFIESHYKSDFVFIGSEKEFAKKNLINAVTNTKYESHYADKYSNEPLYYREVESLYKYSGCGHCFTAIRIEVLDTEISDEDAYKWERKYNKAWYHNYNWDTDKYELNGLFVLVCVLVLILVSVVFCVIVAIYEEKHPTPPVEFRYNYGKGHYERINYLKEKGLE